MIPEMLIVFFLDFYVLKSKVNLAFNGGNVILFHSLKTFLRESYVLVFWISNFKDFV